MYQTYLIQQVFILRRIKFSDAFICIHFIDKKMNADNTISRILKLCKCSFSYNKYPQNATIKPLLEKSEYTAMATSQSH